MTARLLPSSSPRCAWCHLSLRSNSLTVLQLDDANRTISTKTEAVSGLESEVEKLKSSLQTAQSNIEEKASALAALEEAKAKAEEELAALRATLETLQSNSSDDSSKLAAVLLEVCLSVLACNVQGH